MHASIVERGIGYIVDSVLLGATLSLLALAMHSETDFLAYSAPAYYAYKVISETLFGTTVGKYRLRVEPQKYPRLVTALIRNSWLIIPFIFSLGTEFVGRILGSFIVLVVATSIAVDKQERSLFDRLAQAEVMKKAP